MAERFAVQVVYADVGATYVVELEVPAGTTAFNAVERARLNQPELAPPPPWRLGLFGRECAHDTVLEAGDRVEIYRPLINDPKALRRQRAAKQKAQ